MAWLLRLGSWCRRGGMCSSVSAHRSLGLVAARRVDELHERFEARFDGGCISPELLEGRQRNVGALDRWESLINDGAPMPLVRGDNSLVIFGGLGNFHETCLMLG